MCIKNEAEFDNIVCWQECAYTFQTKGAHEYSYENSHNLQTEFHGKGNNNNIKQTPFQF